MSDTLFVISAVIAFMIIYLLFAAKRRNKYDERQTLIRNRGCKYAFITVVVCNLVLLMVVESFNLKIASAFLLLLPIVLGMYVAAGYSIYQGTSIALNAKNIRINAAVFIVIGILESVDGIRGFIALQADWEDNTLYLLLGLFLVLVGLGYLYQLFINKKAK